jgi:Mlc titration factor MtfA (ptsG expression regulator)
MPQDTIWLNPGRTDYVIDVKDIDTPQKNTTEEYVPVRTAFDKKRDEYSQWALPISLALLAGIWIIIRFRFGKSKGYVEIGSRRDTYIDENEQRYTEVNYGQPERVDYYSYYGSGLNFSSQELTAVLTKRSPFFITLNPFEKYRFIARLKKFIACKTFNIHDKSGFREMPILISASAVQVSFGLENFMLPDFATINIYPEVFYRVDDTIKFLEGNVSNGCINISWKYFLQGYEVPNDGQNVGLHEMAHAYYFQNLQCNECEDKKFKETYGSFELHGDKVFSREKDPGNDLYTDYALTNIQEFWAESVEIFFEKPVILKVNYPELYDVMHELLNQDTARRQM